MLLVAAIAFGNVVLQLPLGLLSDRVDRRRLLLVCTAIGFTGAAILPLLASNLVLAVLLLFIWGGFIAGFYTIGLTHLGSRFRGADLASANAAFVMMYSVGSVIGPAAIGTGLDLWPPHGFAYVIAVFFVVYAGRGRGPDGVGPEIGIRLYQRQEIMTRNDFDAYCASLRATTHVIQWGNASVWKVGGKIFAICAAPRDDGQIGLASNAQSFPTHYCANKSASSPPPILPVPIGYSLFRTQRCPMTISGSIWPMRILLSPASFPRLSAPNSALIKNTKNG